MEISLGSSPEVQGIFVSAFGTCQIFCERFKKSIMLFPPVFNLYGFVVGCILVLCFLVFNKTLSGRNYLNVKIN